MPQRKVGWQRRSQGAWQACRQHAATTAMQVFHNRMHTQVQDAGTAVAKKD